jgi:nucleotide-binding universal stress UspA family protein
MFKNILIPTDGSEFSEMVVKDGLALAKLLDAKITGLHVFSTKELCALDEFWSGADSVLQQIRDHRLNEGRRYLDHLDVAARSQGVEFDRVILEHDHVWEAIVDTAREKNCDLVMMAAHGRQGLSALVIGGETNKVLIHSKIPVLVYR